MGMPRLISAYKCYLKNTFIADKLKDPKAANGLYVVIDNDPNGLFKDYGAVNIIIFSVHLRGQEVLCPEEISRPSVQNALW